MLANTLGLAQSFTLGVVVLPRSAAFIGFPPLQEQQGMERPLFLCLISMREPHKNGGNVKKKTKGTAKGVKSLQTDYLQAPWELLKATVLETQRECMTPIKEKPRERAKRKGHSRTVG